MNPLQSIARTAIAGARSAVQVIGGESTARVERARISSAADAAEFHRKLMELVSALPVGPRRDAFTRQREAAKALAQHFEEREERERLKKLFAVELKHAIDGVETRRAVKVQAEREVAAARKAVEALQSRFDSLHVAVQDEQAEAQRNLVGAQSALEAAVVAGDSPQEEQAANALSQAKRRLESDRDSAVHLRFTEVQRTMSSELGKLAAAEKARLIARKDELCAHAGVERIKANAALVEATFARAAWCAASCAAGLDFYSFPHSPFGTEMSYRSDDHRPSVPWNRTALPLDDEAFEVNAAELPDGQEEADTETCQMAAVGGEAMKSFLQTQIRGRSGVRA